MNPHENWANECAGVLQSISELLLKYDNPYQVSVIKDIIEGFKLGGSEYDLAGNDVWGGSGSVVDCNLVSAGGGNVESLRDQREFYRLQIKLADLLIQSGRASTLIKHRRGAAITSVEYLNDTYPQINF